MEEEIKGVDSDGIVSDHYKYVQTSKGKPALMRKDSGILFYSDHKTSSIYFRCMHKKEHKCKAYIRLNSMFTSITNSKVEHSITCSGKGYVVNRVEVITKDTFVELVKA
jgi:hypothetical protein